MSRCQTGKMLQAYKLAIFDFDGTLADSAEVMARALDKAADRFGFRRTTSTEKAELRGLDTRAVFNALGLPSWKLPLVLRFMRRQATEQADAIRLFEGTEYMLRALAEQGIATAVVSSNSEYNVRRIMGPACAELIGTYECNASVFGKARKLRRVLRRAGIAAQNAIYIGDETRDVEAAAVCQLDFGAISWGYARPEVLRQARPTMMFEIMSEIPARIVHQ